MTERYDENGILIEDDNSKYTKDGILIEEVEQKPSPAPTAEKTWKDYKQEIENDIRGNSPPVQYAPAHFVKSIPYVGDASRAWMLSGQAVVDRKPGESFNQAYDRLRKESDIGWSNYEKENPVSSTLTQTTGQMVMPVAGPIAKVKATAPFFKKAAAGAANILGRSTGTGAIVGGESLLKGEGAETALNKGMEAAAYAAPVDLGMGLLKSAVPAVENLKRFRDERLTKATTGQNIADIRKINDTKGMKEYADDLRRPTEIDNEPVVGFGESIEEVRPKAHAAKDNAWAKIEQIYADVDSLTHGETVSLEDVADNILLRSYKTKGVGNTRSPQEGMLKEAEDLYAKAKHGKISLKELQEYKNEYIWKYSQDPRMQALGADATSEIREAFNDVFEKTLAQQNPALAQAWKDEMRMYGSYATASGTTDKRALANVSNRYFSPSDYGMGSVGALTAGQNDMGGASLPKQIGIGIAAGLANKFGRQRGSSAAGVTAEVAAKLMDRGKEKLGPMYNVLADAYRKGPQAFALTHYLLQKNEPKYNQALSDIINEEQSQ